MLTGAFIVSGVCQSSQQLVACSQAGWEGKYNSDEVYFYTLDALPIFTAFCVYSLLHFGYYLPSSSTNTAASTDQPSAAASPKGSMHSMSILGKQRDTSRDGKLLRTQQLV